MTGLGHWCIHSQKAGPCRYRQSCGFKNPRLCNQTKLLWHVSRRAIACRWSSEPSQDAVGCWMQVSQRLLWGCYLSFADASLTIATVAETASLISRQMRVHRKRLFQNKGSNLCLMMSLHSLQALGLVTFCLERHRTALRMLILKSVERRCFAVDTLSLKQTHSTHSTLTLWSLASFQRTKLFPLPSQSTSIVVLESART